MFWESEDKNMKQRIILNYVVVLLCLVVVACVSVEEPTNNQEKISEIVFQDITDMPDAKKKYPFAIQAFNNEDDAKVETKIKKRILATDEIENPEGSDFHILYIESRLTCGTHGCGMSFFEINKIGGYQRMPVPLSANIPVYKKICDNQLSLIFTPGGGMNAGYGEWEYNKGTFAYKTKYSSVNEASVCR